MHSEDDFQKMQLTFKRCRRHSKDADSMANKDCTLLIKVCTVCQDQLSHNMTKQTKWVCALRRLRSAWASDQSNQSLRCPHEESLGLSLRWAHSHFVGFDNCSTWISSRERMAIEMISWPMSTKECFAGPEDRTCNRLNTRQTCIWPSFWAWLFFWLDQTKWLD